MFNTCHLLTRMRKLAYFKFDFMIPFAICRVKENYIKFISKNNRRPIKSNFTIILDHCNVV